MSDAELVREALGRLPENNYRAAELLGVAEGTIRNLRKGGTGELRAGTRSALQRFLRRAADEPTPNHWADIALETVRYVAGEEERGNGERHRIRVDILRGLVKLGLAEGKDVAPLQEALRAMEEAGPPTEKPPPPENGSRTPPPPR